MWISRQPLNVHSRSTHIDFHRLTHQSISHHHHPHVSNILLSTERLLYYMYMLADIIAFKPRMAELWKVFGIIAEVTFLQAKFAWAIDHMTMGTILIAWIVVGKNKRVNFSPKYTFYMSCMDNLHVLHTHSTFTYIDLCRTSVNMWRKAARLKNFNRNFFTFQMNLYNFFAFSSSCSARLVYTLSISTEVSTCILVCVLHYVSKQSMKT